MIRFSLFIAVALGLVASPVSLRAQDVIQPTYKMMSDPEIVLPKGVTHLHERLLPLWTEALKRPESEILRSIAEAVALAHRREFPGLETLSNPLAEALVRDGVNPLARCSLAETLIKLDRQDQAATLHQASVNGPIELKLICEPALARWKYEPARDAWVKRVADPKTPRRELTLAIECLRQWKDEPSQPGLVAIAIDRSRPADIRLAAARAAGDVSASGLESAAAAISAETVDPPPGVIDRLCAVSLLRQQDSPSGRDQLNKLAVDVEPSVAAAALDALFAFDPTLVLPLAEGAIASADANVRWQGLRALVTTPTVERVTKLGVSLGDRHPRNRGYVRDWLFELSKRPELDAAVRTADEVALARDDWRPQEQAALLAAALDHEPVANRLVELLPAPRTEVKTATGWALRMLAVPETLAPMLAHLTKETDDPAPGGDNNPQRAHLFEAMALMGYKEAIPLMKRYIPKRPPETCRAAAVWGLGILLAGNPDEEIAELLIARAKETTGMPPEFPLVRQMSVISIARMKAVSQVPALKELIGPEADAGSDDQSIRWALIQLTGEVVPPADPVEGIDTGWFLEPVP
jgi:hypothetical protein